MKKLEARKELKREYKDLSNKDRVEAEKERMKRIEQYFA